MLEKSPRSQSSSSAGGRECGGGTEGFCEVVLVGAVDAKPQSSSSSTGWMVVVGWADGEELASVSKPSQAEACIFTV